MTVFGKMYFFLFNKITDALEALEKCNYGQASDLLKAAQVEAERIYLSSEEGSREERISYSISEN